MAMALGERIPLPIRLLVGIALLAGQAVRAASPLSVPSTGIYLGVWADPSLAGGQEKAIEIREGSSPNGINRSFALHLDYYAWTDLSQELDGSGVFHPDPQLLGDISHGRVPVISWACDSSGMNTNSDHVIAGGDPGEDAVITATAKALAQYPGPVLLRWMWEFNDLANHQDCLGYTSGTPTQQVYSDFIGAWRHIWQLFQSAGATNVVFLWNAAHYDADGNADDPHGFYPGNNYVDWIGIDTYQRSETETFDDDFGLFYSDFTTSRFESKPLMVGENGAQNFVQNNSELQWTYLQGLLSDVQANRYPLLKAYDYFDSVGTNGSWVLDDNNGQGNGGLAAFAILGASPSFAPVNHPAFFAGEDFLSGIVYYLAFPDGNLFGYYEYLSSSILYHFDMGYEAFIPSTAGQIYFFDFASGHWWYTSPSQFPNLYDFTLGAWIYYFPDTRNVGHYTTNPRYFANLSTGNILKL